MTDHLRVSERMADNAADKTDDVGDVATRVALNYVIASLISLTNEVQRLSESIASNPGPAGVLADPPSKPQETGLPS